VTRSPLESNRLWAAAAALAAVVAVAWFVRIAWVGDDAYIVFRSVEQLFAGNGPRWNPHERVQVFTSPLWYGYLCLFRLFSEDVFLNAIFASGIALVFTLILIKRLVGSPLVFVTALALLFSSTGFVDYTSSGLENPLGFLLLAAFLMWFFRADRAPSQSELLVFFLCFAIVLTCRLDLVTLAAPPAAFVVFRHRSAFSRRRWVGLVTIGLSPLLAWLLFALVYYGSLFPNPAYSKLATGLPRGAYVVQGLEYLLANLRQDPATIVIVAAGLATMLRFGDARVRVVAIAVVLNLAYVVWVGGDFMLGRFLGCALFVTVLSALVVVGGWPERWRAATLCVVLAACASFWALSPHSPARNVFHHEERPHLYGVADERYSYWRASLAMYLERDDDAVFPAHSWAEEGRAFRDIPEAIAVRHSVGFFGYWAGTEKIVVDTYALCDPLRARLPMEPGQDWRIGHFIRPMVEGYIESIAGGENRIADPRLRRYYERIRIVTQSERLFGRRRLGTIVALNLGAYDHLIDEYAARR
jgi:arabinofuranosyltransferase